MSPHRTSFHSTAAPPSLKAPPPQPANTPTPPPPWLCGQVVLLLLKVGKKTLGSAQEPEGMLYKLIQNHIKMMTQAKAAKVQVG